MAASREPWEVRRRLEEFLVAVDSQNRLLRKRLQHFCLRCRARLVRGGDREGR